MSEQFIAAQKVLEALEKAGYEAYLVGGCVRDSLLNKEPADYDVTTNALPGEVQKIFPRTVPTGLQHGTVSVIQNKTVVEVTTFRVDGTYEDCRRPRDVKFVSNLKDDLMRRDFTINALAMDRDGNVIDYVDGRIDLKRGLIRTVGKAEERFKEDALRMMRACRFAAQLSFQIEESTKVAINTCKCFANHLAVERIVAEFTRIWKTNQPSKGLIPLVETGLLGELPPFYETSITPNIQQREWENLDRFETHLEKWVYFFYLVFRDNENHKQVCKANIIDVLPKFKFSNSEKKTIFNMINLIASWNPNIKEKEGKLLLLKHHFKRVQLAEKLWRIISWRESSLPLEKWWTEMPVHHFSELAINGNDLLRVTERTPGPWIRETLQYLFYQVAFGHIKNQKQVLEKEGGKYGAGITP
ncbi:CCA tRNA nucleotidyltransferase [Shimazuella sp. AN120528]|uniref:CCA tRNA nucleotidyltransferase n=1 Tax=Shimazuella soli TaxID=1892854 RepID=UPI001F0E7145|nr:CCA tRNA nucleotidyltransferase [Shimazuella soli]MCH5585471.1 CCA tRNA nucleotidyltransferase [Shimazuella soli]